VSFGIVVFFVFGLVVPAAAAVVEPELRLVIRTYDAPGTSGDMSQARETATVILEGTGIGITWLECDAVFVWHDENPCLAPLAANELAVRFMRLPPHLAEQDVVILGDSLIDTRLRTGSLATIYVNRVATLARRCGVDAETLLARAVAHEIGHLLLGTSAHASSGLMRAAWSQTALRRAAVEEWRFTAADGLAIRESVRARTARLLAATRLGE